MCPRVDVHKLCFVFPLAIFLLLGVLRVNIFLLCSQKSTEGFGALAGETSLAGGRAVAAPVWRKERVEEMHEKLAWWLAVNKRPVNLLEDKAFKDSCRDMSSGAYASLDHTKALACTIRMCSKGLEIVVPNQTGLNYDPWNKKG